MAKLRTYWGLASANGLESFIWEPTTGRAGFDQLIIKKEQTDSNEEQKKMAYQTAYWNRHRHSVFYQVEIEPEDAKAIEALMGEDPEEALIQLKEKAKKIMLATNIPGTRKSWDLIPNKDLDPYS